MNTAKVKNDAEAILEEVKKLNNENRTLLKGIAIGMAMMEDKKSTEQAG